MPVSDRPYHHGQLRQSLITVALEALERDGELPSLRALAKACGVSQSAPYRHFASLDDLRLALLIEGFRRLAAAIVAAQGELADPFERLAAGTRAYITFGLGNPALYDLMFAKRDAITAVPDAAAAGLGAYDTLIGSVRACGVSNPKLAAFVLWTGQHGFVDIQLSGLRVPGGVRELERLIGLEVDMLVGYVRGLVEAQERALPVERLGRESDPPDASTSE